MCIYVLLNVSNNRNVGTLQSCQTYCSTWSWGLLDLWMLVFHLGFGDLSVELSASHVSCCYTFYFYLFTCFFFLLPPTPPQLLGCVSTSLASIIPGSDEPTGGGKKVTTCERRILLRGASHTEQEHESVVHVLLFRNGRDFLHRAGFAQFRPMIMLQCFADVSWLDLWIRFHTGFDAHMFICTVHVRTDTQTLHERGMKGKVAARRGRTETDRRQAEGNEKGIRGSEGRVISGRIHYVVCVSLYHQTAYYVQVISSSARFHKENPFTCARMNQQLSLFRAAEPRKRVCFHFLYHVVLGSCLFSSSDAWKYCGQENRVQVFFLLRSLWVRPASDWSRDKHLSYISSGFAEAGS